VALGVVSLVGLGLLSAGAAGVVPQGGVAPGAPGAQATWTPADKHGFGTAMSRRSPVWFTLRGGELSEVYFPDASTPSYRDLQFVVSDGASFAQRDSDSSVQITRLAGLRSPTFRQVDTDRAGRWRLTKTYVADPARATVLVDVRFQSLTGRPYQLYVLAHPALLNDGMHNSASCAGARLVASGGRAAAAVLTSPRLRATSCGYEGASDGWTDLSSHHRMTWHYRSAPNGNVMQLGQTALNGRGRHQRLTVALGFASSPVGALAVAHASLSAGWTRVARRYSRGWSAYLAGLRRRPPSLRSPQERRVYAVSQMALAASEDKSHPGAYVASPTMPWAWGTGLQTPSGPYHLVWSRDLYEIATALLAEGDHAGALRSLHFLFDRQQQADGSFPQNSTVTGAPVLTNLQLDEVADPIVLAWQLGARNAWAWMHVKRAADFIVGWHDAQGHAAPYSPQERWENQGGYSPATIAAEIGGLVCAADIARANGDVASATRYEQTADAWRAHLDAWTLTTTGPYGSTYYLRLAKDGNPNAPTTYNVGDSGPANIDQRAVVDPSYLELVRLGIKAPKDPAILATLKVVDAQLAVTTPSGQFWHRYTGDGYGEGRDGSPWAVGQPPGSQTTVGRLWPIFAGERGEYELAAGQPAASRLAAMAAATNDVGFIPEQVWDQNPPSGSPGFTPGSPTFSATPLAWSHAQFIRLAWSITAGRPLERPTLVACRYVLSCSTGH
jgi:glucoamylase